MLSSGRLAINVRWIGDFPRFANVCLLFDHVLGTGDGPERDETLRWMHKIGPHKVRGWKFVRRGALTKMELQEVESNIRELFDLCRACGKKGHFARYCPKAAAAAAGTLRRKSSISGRTKRS